MEIDFLAPRPSFLPPIVEVAKAAGLLALAADSLLLGDMVRARSYVGDADTAALRAYTRSIMSQTTRSIHRLRIVTDHSPPAASPLSARRPRQPSAATALGIYRRDGFRCRYCGCRIVFPRAQAVIAALLPGAVQWGDRDIELNAAFYTLKGVLDHVEPFAHGGTSNPANIVVSCQPCNYGKGDHFIQQLGLSDPRDRPPSIDGWEGLMRVLTLKPSGRSPTTIPDALRPIAATPPTLARRTVPRKAPVSIDDFAQGLSAENLRHLETLLQVVDDGREFGVFWTVGLTLLIKVPAPLETIIALGVERDMTVQVPWSVGPYKAQFRPFAETLAAALPSGTAYETNRMWRVHCSGQLPSLRDLAQQPGGLKDAFAALHRALTNHSVVHG